MEVTLAVTEAAADRLTLGVGEAEAEAAAGEGLADALLVMPTVKSMLGNCGSSSSNSNSSSIRTNSHAEPQCG